MVIQVIRNGSPIHVSEMTVQELERLVARLRTKTYKTDVDKYVRDYYVYQNKLWG